MNNSTKAILAGAGAVIIVGGALVYNTLDSWFTPEPEGPGSGDEVDLGNGPGEPGPGSGDELMPGEANMPEGPGSGDEVDLGNGPGEPEGPGSGDEVIESEPEGPGSGDEVIESEPEGPGSGDEMPADEPTGPGSGDEVTTEEPTGPGSGDEMPADEPTGPGSGDEADVIGSCDMINFGSTCVDYIGSYWATIEYAIANCSNEGTWSENPCPQPSMGGCNTNAEQSTEMIIWHYNYGGDPFDAELAGYAAQACAINPFGTWIGN